MLRVNCQRTSSGERNLASIDVGSHTARLLVSKRIGPSGLFRPLVRKRVYIRLAEGFDDQGNWKIKQEAIERTRTALEDFASITRRFRVESTHAVCTGVMRRAANRDDLLNLIYGHTGIKARVISGDEEAQLTGKGVSQALRIQRGPFMIFDLGGGSTEFIYEQQGARKVKSTPLGAMILTQKYLISDPPEEKKIKALARAVDGVLEDAFPEGPYLEDNGVLVGTGGTVTSLATMIYGIETEEITPERMNGLIIKRKGLEALLARIKIMNIKERLRLPGLDRGRADVILAGSLVVIRILHFFKSLEMLVSLSDLLEGILIDYLEGEEDG